MKKFNTSFHESESPVQGADIQTPIDGNVTNALNQGVSNHYIPLQNIVINVRNLFAPYFGLVVDPSEDNKSLRIYCSMFTDENIINRVLNYKPDGHTSLKSYVSAQGLPYTRLVWTGSSYVVYFYAKDLGELQIPDTRDTIAYYPPALPSGEIEGDGIGECELSTIESVVYESVEDAPLYYSGEIDMEDALTRTLREVANMQDKVKACGEWENAVRNHVTLPDGYYWKAVKDRDGMESIALRKKFSKRRPFGKEIPCVKSIINIYNGSKDGIWVEPFDNKDSLTREERQLIDNVLSFIKANPDKTDPCVFGLKQPVDSNNANESIYNIKDTNGTIIETKNSMDEALEFVLTNGDYIIEQE